MAAPFANASRFLREMVEAEERGEPYLWGNVFNLSEGAIEELGIKGAMAERDQLSSHVASSGESYKMPRKMRKEHYARKIAKYQAHEAERRARWERRHPGAPEENWKEREAAHRAKRNTRRAARRAAARRSSNRKGSNRTQRRQ
jgi:hypothetical protein